MKPSIARLFPPSNKSCFYLDIRIGCKEFTLIFILSTLLYIAHIFPKLLIHKRPLDLFNRSHELLLNLKMELPPNRAVLKLASMSLPRCTGNISSCFEHSKKYTPAGLAETCWRETSPAGIKDASAD